MKKINKKIIALSAILLLCAASLLPNALTRHAAAQTRTCMSVVSGNGAEGTTDSVVQFFDGTNYQPAFIIPPHVDNDGQPPDTNYAVIPGTHYVAVTVDGAGAEQSDFHYRATFTLPALFNNPTLTVQVHCDNQATIFLNGHNLGSQPFAEDIINFQDPAEVFTSNNAAHFVPGSNVIEFTVHNFTDKTALDFKADICFDAGCRDEDPPSVNCTVKDNQLWPANHDLVNVGFSAQITDDCDCNSQGGQASINHNTGKDRNGGNLNCNPGTQTAVEVLVYSDEPDLDILGSGNFSPDAKNIGLNTLRLRAERSGNADGRVYLIVVKATDSTGKNGYCAKTVTVPHDQSRASKDSVESQATAARTYYLSHHTPPPNYVQVGTGPVVGPKQ
jgi:hypothetical protein